MSAHAAAAHARSAPRTLTVRRPLVAPAIDHRRLLRTMRRWLVRRTITLGLVLVGLCLVQVWLRLQVVDVGYRLSEMRQMQLRLEQQRREQEVELAMLRDKTHLVALATSRLGLQEPKNGQVVDLR